MYLHIYKFDYNIKFFIFSSKEKEENKKSMSITYNESLHYNKNIEDI